MSLATLSTATSEHLKHAHVIVKNSLWSVLKASGSDLRTYLQGQITQDINKLTNQQAIHSCILTPQGKAVSELFMIAGQHDELIILTPSSHAEATVARLRQFAIAHQLRIGIVDSLSVYAVYGSATFACLDQFSLPDFTSAETEPAWLSCSRKQDDDLYALHMHSNPQHCWLIGEAKQIEPHISDPNLSNQYQLLDTELEALRILYGLPVFGIEWNERMHPLNANLVELDGVDFNKGCYVGQEVTSRMHWRGGIKKKLYRVKLAESPTELPCAIRSSVKIGELLSAARDDQDQYIGIALLPIETVESLEASETAETAETAESNSSLTIEPNNKLTILEACHA
ncbi:MAG: folate-binding protein [Mariprofundus sp.]|nr:folate-binding protein [Mariprofundus sp.]